MFSNTITCDLNYIRHLFDCFSSFITADIALNHLKFNEDLWN